MASTRPITSMDKVGINKAVVAKINIEALATTVEALMEGTVKNRQFIKKELLEDR